MSGTPDFPGWPDGFWRRIELRPENGAVSVALEDNVHRFHLRLAHDGVRVTGIEAEVLRFPMSTCPGAGPFLAGELAGRALGEVAAIAPAEHCTHLRDLAILCANHAGDTAPVRFDMWVSDRTDGRATAELAVDGNTVLEWHLDGTAITGPRPGGGRDLRQLSQWSRELDPVLAEHAVLLRRAVFVSGVRAFRDGLPPLTGDWLEARLGACYTYRAPRAFGAERMPDWYRDFAESGTIPLSEFGVGVEQA
jgi:Protein of unknown function (DUF2889)